MKIIVPFNIVYMYLQIFTIGIMMMNDSIDSSIDENEISLNREVPISTSSGRIVGAKRNWSLVQLYAAVTNRNNRMTGRGTERKGYQRHIMTSLVRQESGSEHHSKFSCMFYINVETQHIIKDAGRYNHFTI